MRLRLAYGIVFLFGFGVFVGSGSCSLFANLSADPPNTDAGPDSGVEAGPVDDGCRLAEPPKMRPGLPDDGGTSFYAVMRSIKFDGDFGFDLDKRCTCYPHDGGTCSPPANVDADVFCDGDGGIDNAFGKLAATNFGFLLDKTMKREIEGGTYSLLFRVDDYNGGPDDRSVTLSFFQSIGPAREGGVNGPTVAPSFTRADEWTIDLDGVESVSGPTAKERVQNAYVVDGVLVAPTSGRVTIARGVDIAIEGAVLTAKIERDDAGDFYLKNVVVAGRWKAQSAIAGIGTIDVEERVPVCRSDGGAFVWTLAKTLICGSLDVADRENVACDAISIAAHIETAAVFKTPKLEPNKPDFDRCADAAVVVTTQCND